MELILLVKGSVWAYKHTPIKALPDDLSETAEGSGPAPWSRSTSPPPPMVPSLVSISAGSPGRPWELSWNQIIIPTIRLTFRLGPWMGSSAHHWRNIHLSVKHSHTTLSFNFAAALRVRITLISFKFN